MEISSENALVPSTVTDASPTASVASARFLDHCRVGKNLAGNTLRAYESDLDHFVEYLGNDVQVGCVDRDRIREYARVLMDGGRLKETTVKRRIATLKILFRWLEREEVIQFSVFHRLELSIKLPKRLPRALNSSEMHRLLVGASARLTKSRRRRERHDAAVIHFALVALFTTGLRIGELVSVKLTDVSLHDGSIQVRGKGNRERRVYMAGKQAVTVLKQFLDIRRRTQSESENVLITAEGLPITAQQIRKELRRLATRAGLARRVTPHMLRHTAATQLLEAGVDIRVVQRLLGHASIATTQIYTHVSDAALKERLAQANTLRRLGRDRDG